MTIGERLAYVDEKGDKLYGFSQTSLDRQTFWIKMLVAVGAVAITYVLWLTYYVISKGVINNIVARCVG